MTLSGFPASCDGATAVLQLWGNAAGDPSVPLRRDKLLSTADSSVDPCTGKPLKAPALVVDGSITLHLCAKAGPGAYADVHDLTKLALFVNGASVPVSLKAAGGGTTPGSSGTPAGASGSRHAATKAAGGGPSLLAFTGSDISLAFWAGVLAVLLGLILGIVDRRRRRAAKVTST